MSFKDSTNKVTAVVGSVAGASIVFGTPVQLGNGRDCSIAFDPTTPNRFVVVTGYQTGGRSFVCTISGTVITAGPETTYNAGDIYVPEIVFDPSGTGKNGI